MYDQAVTGQQLENAEKRLGQKLRRYSVDEVIAARARLDSLYDESGKPTRTPTSEEKRFIQNERTLCRWDFNYWCSRYHHILHWDQSRGIVRFEPNIAQKIFLDIISDAERRAWAIMLLILKARQEGISTVCEAIVGHRVQFHSNVRAIIASARPGQSEKMFGMMELSWENQPWYLKPFATFHRAGELIAFAAQNSMVSVEHGAKIKSDIGRGSTPSAVHLSECSEFLNPKDDIDAALLNSIHENPGLFVALESTAKGMGNWWHQKWLYAKEHYDNIYQPSRLRPVFLPWYVACLSPGTPIITANGMIKTMREIRQGDVVTTHSGHQAEVLGLVRSQRCNEITSDLWLWGNSAPLSCTRDHPVLTETGWKPAGSLCSGDYVVFPVRPILANRREIILKHLPHGKSAVHPLERVFALDYNWGRLLGLYLAEGSASVNWRRGVRYLSGISIACHSNEVEKFSKYLEMASGNRIGVGRRTANHGAELRVNDSSLARWIVSNFGTCDTKRVPDWVWLCGREFCKGLIFGYLEGDGSITDTDATIGARSVRLQLPVQFRSLIASLGYGWCQINWFPASYSSKSGRGGWWLQLRNSTSIKAREDLGWSSVVKVKSQKKPEHWHWVADGQAVAIEIERNLDGFSQEFFDLTIDSEDHSFTTLQCAVHNSDIYPTETWLRRNPVPESWQPAELTRNHAKRAEAYVATTLTKYLGRDWKMPLEQQWFWEVSYREAKETRTLNKFFTECCGDDLEAFQQEQQSVFDVELLTEYRNACPRPEGIYALEGPLDEIRAELRPDRRLIDTDQPPVTIDHRYQMVPLKMTGYPNIDPHAKILIWRKPQDEYEYALGVDTSDGVGLDRSVIQVVRKATLTECALQCVEFASPYIGAADLVPFAYAIGKYYQRSCQGELREPQMVVEVNNGGDACQLGLRKQGWNNFYHWVKLDRKLLQPSRATVLGVVTSTWYRKVLTEYLTKALKDCFIEINSPWFVNEMGTLGRDEDVSRIRAESGTHDDRFFALGFAFIALHIYDWQTDYKSVFGRPHSALLPPPAQTEYATLPPTPMEQPVFDAAIDRVINGEAPFEERPNYDSFMTEAPSWEN